MIGAVLVVAWAGGIIWGAASAIGLIELLTARMLILPRQWSWTAGEARVHGAATAAAGLAMALLTLVGAFVLSTSSGPTWRGPDWWYTIEFLEFPLVLSFGFTPLLLEQHHKQRWPFARRGTAAE